MRLVASAEAENLHLSFIDIFKNPRLGDLAMIGSRAVDSRTNQQPLSPFSLLPQASGGSTDALMELSKQCCVHKHDVQDAYPASPLQEALLTLSIKQPGAYIAQHVLALDKSLDIAKIKNAWQKAVQEIDILRTRIAQLPSGEFFQVVLKEDAIKWQETTSLDEAEKTTVCIPTCPGDRLACYTIVQTSSRETYLVWTIHHALYDGWSINLILQRVEQLYQMGTSVLPLAPYTNFIQYLEGVDRDASKAFWKENLSNASPNQFPQLPVDASKKTHVGKSLSHNFKIGPMKHNDVTASNLIRAAWALLIAAYTDNDDVV